MNGQNAHQHFGPGANQKSKSASKHSRTTGVLTCLTLFVRLFTNTLTETGTKSGLSKSIHFRLTEDEYAQLESLAKAEHRKVSDMIRFILAKHMAEDAALQESPSPYRVAPTDTEIQAAVRAATESAVKEVMDKLRR